MPRTITPDQAVRALRKLERERQRLVFRAWQKWLPWARDRSVKFYMHAGGSVSADPRNLRRRKRLTHRTGRLGRSTKIVGPTRKGEEVVGGLTSTAPYSSIHEKGGSTRPHLILPRRAKVLRWQTPSGPRFARSVRHPGSRIRARPRIGPALADAFERSVREINKGLREARVRMGL